MDFNGSSVSAECIVPIESITTGIDLRDQHMKNKYLETNKFPEATLTITDLKLNRNFLDDTGSQKNIPF